MAIAIENDIRGLLRELRDIMKALLTARQKRGEQFTMVHESCCRP
ncbi:hypothetical protein [Mesorhizobium sp.]|nr:hypothetical protein [Mesorhizobium sp.]